MTPNGFRCVIAAICARGCDVFVKLAVFDPSLLKTHIRIIEKFAGLVGQAPGIRAPCDVFDPSISTNRIDNDLPGCGAVSHHVLGETRPHESLFADRRSKRPHVPGAQRWQRSEDHTPVECMIGPASNKDNTVEILCSSPAIAILRVYRNVADVLRLALGSGSLSSI
jgi:hypothetical protein